MVSFIDCLFSAVLIVGGITVEIHDPTFRGSCIHRGVEEVFVNDHHQLIIIHNRRRYEIPIPSKDGAWSMRYLIGTERATMGPWGQVMVRHGPYALF